MIVYMYLKLLPHLIGCKDNVSVSIGIDKEIHGCFCGVNYLSKFVNKIVRTNSTLINNI